MAFSTPVWSTPKIWVPFANVLDARGQLDLVEQNFDRVAYYPWARFDDAAGRFGDQVVVTRMDRLGLAGLAHILEDGTAVAYIATKGRTFREVADTLEYLARRLSSTQSNLGGRRGLGFPVFALCVLFGATVVALIAVGSKWFHACGLFQPPQPQQGDLNSMQDNEKSLQKLGDNLPNDLPRPGRDPFLDLPPLPQHSHEFEGRIREKFKRARIRSHSRTTEEFTALAEQENELYDQLIPLGNKRYELDRIRDRAVVDDLKVQRDATQVESEIHRMRCEMRKMQAQTAVEIAQLQASLSTADGRGETRTEGRTKTIEDDVERISEEIASIAGLEEACREMKERSPAYLHPVIDRLFRKEIDRRKERL